LAEPFTLKGDHMLVDVLFEKQYIAQLTVEVPEDATTEQVEEAAKREFREDMWVLDHNDIIKLVLVEESNTPSL